MPSTQFKLFSIVTRVKSPMESEISIHIPRKISQDVLHGTNTCISDARYESSLEQPNRILLWTHIDYHSVGNYSVKDLPIAASINQ